jgi:FkbH-like protein
VSLFDWIGHFPELQKKTIVEAVETASLAKVRRALRLLDELPPEGLGRAFNVELLSTFNLEPFLPVLQLALSCIPSRPDLRLAPLNDLEGYITQNTGADQRDVRVIVWRIEELLPEALYPFSNGFPEQLSSRTEEVVSRVHRLVKLHEAHAPAIPLFISTVAFPVHFSNPLFASQHAAAICGAIAHINRTIYDIATGRSGVYVFDVCRWAALEGKLHADALLDFVARQPLSSRGQVAFALFLARCLRPLLIPARKVLAVDLDDTLWGGVVGEDGLENLKLGHDFPGNVHLRIQRELLELRNRGILLILLSKNNEADARQPFDCLPDMLLKWEDFTLRKVNWKAKHENLREAAQELGLGLDSFVFVDDSDYEREQMRQLIPEVLILNSSSDPLHTLNCLWTTDAFDSLTITEEDRRRHDDYRVRAGRDVQAHGNDLEEFLHSLQMEATIEELGPANMERAVAMIGKTNQFNLTTRRHSRAQVQAILVAPGSIGLALRLRDKFGDQGIVAILLATPPAQDGTLVVDSFLVSCRALGRGVEDALWAALVERANEAGIHKVLAEYLPTPKNGIVARLYDRFGLQRLEHSLNSTRYVLESIEVQQPPAWIHLTKKDNAKQ